MRLSNINGKSSRSIPPPESPLEIKPFSKDQMLSMLSSEYSPSQLESDFLNCCSEHEKCSSDLAKIATLISDLHKLRPAQYVDRVAHMESSLQEKCHQIKKQRSIIA